MDFNKIKPAVEEIQLSEIQMERITKACENKKRKSFNYKLWIPVAAAAMFAVVIFSPGFLFRAKEADMAAQGSNDLKYAADEEVLFDSVYAEDSVMEIVTEQSSTAAKPELLFSCEGFREIYALVPLQFVWLVDADEYEEWKNTVDSSNGMAMMQFIEHFSISREAFDSANEAYEAYIGSSEENNELFNADIIYSFDKNEIDSYYSEETK